MTFLKLTNKRKILIKRLDKLIMTHAISTLSLFSPESTTWIWFCVLLIFCWFVFHKRFGKYFPQSLKYPQSAKKVFLNNALRKSKYQSSCFMHLMGHLFSDVEGYPGQNSIVIDAKSKYRTKVYNIISSFHFGRYKNVLFTTLYLVSILRCSKVLDHKVGECSRFWFIYTPEYLL